MQLITSYKDKWKQIPSPIRKMFLAGSVMLIIWKTVYTFWLEPNRILDGPLTGLVAHQTAQVMQLIWPESNYTSQNVSKAHKGDTDAMVSHIFILKDGDKTISIADNCNGLELMVLYAAFIIIMPGKVIRKSAFIAFGIPILHLANLFRCTGLVFLHLQWPGAFDFAHHYLFKIMVYAISFLLWIWYLRPITKAIKQDA